MEVRWIAAPALAAALAAIAIAVPGGVPAASAASAAATSGTIRFTQSTWTADEGSGYVTVSVERVGGLAVSTADVDYATSGGTATAGADYVDTAGTLHFAVGATMTTFTVALLDDATPEPTETVGLRLGGVRGGDWQAGPPATIVLRDDDTGAGPASGATATPRAPAASSYAAGATPTAGAASSSVGSRPATGTPATRRTTVGAAQPSPTSKVRPPTPFELHTSAGDAAGDAPLDDGTHIDPLLALAAGLLFARVAAEVWFRIRLPGVRR